MSILRKIFPFMGSIIARAEESFLCLLLFSMILLACLQIFLRIFFSSGIVWIDPLLRYMVIWAGLFGAAVATRQSKHISIDILSHLLPDQFRPWLQGLLNFFSAGVCSVLAYAAVIFVRDEALYGGRGLLGVPSWWYNLVYPAAFGIIACRFLVLAYRNLVIILQHKSTFSQT